MNCRKCKFILIFSIISLILITFYSRSNPPIISKSSAYLLDPVINIDSDADFIALGLDGNGSINNPYLIQDYVIDVSGMATGIYVSGTSKHFIIQNCTVKEPSSQAYDEGSNNLWYNETTQIGNYWSDWDYCNTGGYKIDGLSNSEDLYPSPFLVCLCPCGTIIPAYWGFGGIFAVSLIALVLITYFRKIKNRRV